MKYLIPTLLGLLKKCLGRRCEPRFGQGEAISLSISSIEKRLLRPDGIGTRNDGSRVFQQALLYSLLFAVATNGYSAPLDPDTQKLYQKIDSLFVIASSGEVKYRDMVEPAVEAIAQIGAAAVPPLIDKLDTKSARDRVTIINILTKIGSPAVPQLVEALGRPDWLVVQRICWALGDIKDSGAVESLKQTAHHPNWQVREYSLRALGLIGNIKGLSTVINAFNDSLGPVRKAAAYAAGGMKKSEVIPQLVGALGDDFYGARFGAMEALLLLDTAEVITQLEEAMQSATGLKAILICQTLGKIGNSEALDILNHQLDSDKIEQRTYAAVALISADPDDICGFHERIHKQITDRLALVQIESARKQAQYESPVTH